MATFWTADTHIGHARINELAGRPFSSVTEMNAQIIERWNDTVSDEDEIIVLGDLVMGKFDESIQLAKGLRGRKWLVPGNHDRVSTLYRGSVAKKSEWLNAYGDAGFLILPESCWTDVNGTSMMMCHFPFEGDSHDEDRYIEARPKDDGQWLLHGHVHESWKIRDRQINVGVDVWDFNPVSKEQIMELINTS